MVSSMPSARAPGRPGVRVAQGPISAVGTYVVVGLMVAWSEYDRRLAVGLERAVTEGAAGTDMIEVFNGDEVTTLQDLNQYIPDLGDGAAQSPWVGVWKDGRPWFSLGGASAIAWLQDRYGISSI